MGRLYHVNGRGNDGGDDGRDRDHGVCVCGHGHARGGRGRDGRAGSGRGSRRTSGNVSENHVNHVNRGNGNHRGNDRVFLCVRDCGALFPFVERHWNLFRSGNGSGNVTLMLILSGNENDLTFFIVKFFRNLFGNESYLRKF